MKIILMSILFCMSLTGCQTPAKPVNRPPITCMERIKTNSDLVNCLVEYDEKY